MTAHLTKPWIAETISSQNLVGLRAWFQTREERDRVAARWKTCGIMVNIYRAAQ